MLLHIQGFTVNKFVASVLSLALFGALPAAQAASVSVDAGTFVFTYDDSFLPGAAFSHSEGVFSFSNLAMQTYAIGAELESNGAGAFFGYDGIAPLYLTPKAGYAIAGVTESISGSFAASPADIEGSTASVGAVFVSRWVQQDGGFLFGQNMGSQIPADLSAGQGVAHGGYQAVGSLDFSAAAAANNLPAGAVMLSHLDLVVTAGAQGLGSGAIGSLDVYRMNVQVVPVPEPEGMALALVGAGIIGVSTLRRRWRQ